MSGTLFYLIGARGCGKESLLQFVQQNLYDNTHVRIAHRYSTKPNSETDKERYTALSRAEFNKRLHGGKFAIAWESEGNFYGIDQEVNEWLAQGYNVLINGSRVFLPMARKLFAHLVPVYIQIKPENLTLRLMFKHTNQTDEIRRSIQRECFSTDQFNAPDIVTLDNNGPLHIAGNRLLSIINPTFSRKIC